MVAGARRLDRVDQVLVGRNQKTGRLLHFEQVIAESILNLDVPQRRKPRRSPGGLDSVLLQVCHLVEDPLGVFIGRQQQLRLLQDLVVRRAELVGEAQDQAEELREQMAGLKGQAEGAQEQVEGTQEQVEESKEALEQSRKELEEARKSLKRRFKR
ncbi:MAG: hypothetical protein IIA40_09220 [SAR324 cluster bacterium]|nr:hypothetical protein [SAR324 cluster bacterium]